MEERELRGGASLHCSCLDGQGWVGLFSALCWHGAQSQALCLIGEVQLQEDQNCQRPTSIRVPGLISWVLADTFLGDGEGCAALMPVCRARATHIASYELRTIPCAHLGLWGLGGGGVL